MSGGVKAGWISALAVSGLMLGVANAQAADLGGDCCSDLEERVAELEATTARKGNRKVSLTISGWVNESVTFWDDGTESNVYVGTNSLEQSRFKFAGKAKINKDFEAGYTLEVGVNGHASNKWNQTAPSSSSDNVLTLRKSNWYIKSKTYGKVTVGLDGTSTYHLLDDADGANTRNVSDAEASAVYQGAFLIRSNGALTSLKWSDVERGFNNGTPGQSGRRNVVKYDTPEFGGFTASVSWGEDDMWDSALTYKGEFHEFKLLGKIGYGESTDPTATGCGTATEFKCTWWGAAGTLMHAPTGLYVYGGYGEQKVETITAGLDDTSTTWFVQPGIERKWHELGKTTVFGEYRKDEAGANPGKTLGADLTFWSAGLVQNIEAASMDLYVMYRHAEGDYTTGSVAVPVNHTIDDFDMVIAGSRIQF
ncbi:Porin [Hyphomicrobium sp. 1Nfss2.1]|uniref:porin n=1 Tax=Hyphomicrobium sp. 1Nfss2.1 TaxID=3413936 RepID=UPI003C7B6256